MVVKRRMNYIAFTCLCGRVVKLRRRMSQWRLNRVVLCNGDSLHGHVRNYPPFKHQTAMCDVQVVRYWRSRGYDRYTFYHVSAKIEELFHIRKMFGMTLAEAAETWKLMNDKVQLPNAS